MLIYRARLRNTSNALCNYIK